MSSVLERLSAAWPEAGSSQRSALVFVVFAAATLFCIVVPRIGPLVVISVTTALSVYLLARDTQREGWSAVERVIFRPELLFALWAIVASTWSPEPMRGVGKSLFLLALLLHAIILVRNLHLADGRDVEMAARGLLTGFLLGGAYVCLEVDSRSTLTRSILTQFPELERALPKHARFRDGVIVRMSGAHLTRVNAVFCLFVCPALLAVALYTRSWMKWLCHGAIAFLSLFIFFHPQTHSQTSQLVIAVIGAVLAVAFIAPRLARWAVGIGFAAWLFLIVPGSIALYSYGVHENQDLFRSARARVLIWHDTATEILKSPIVGRGTSAARFHDEAPETKKKIRTDELGGGLGGRSHPHNMYLQIWYELGIIGVLAFALLGYSLWKWIARLPRTVAIYAITHFAACVTIIGPSYGLWQNWFQSAFVTSILALLLIASSAMTRTKPPEGSGPPSS